MKFLPLALLLGLSVGLVSLQASCDSPSTTSPQEGELQLEGKVERIEPSHIVISASAFTNPNGKRAPISPPKTKAIVLPGPQGSFALKVGDKVVVTGRHDGPAALFIAREIIQLNTPGAPQAERPFLEYKAGMLPQWNAGKLEVQVEKAGFDYSTRFLPRGSFTFETAPVFYTIFRVNGLEPKANARNLVDLRRYVGPQHEFSPSNNYEFKDLPAQAGTRRFVCWSSRIDPSWEFVDMDVDTIYSVAPTGHTDTGLAIENARRTGILRQRVRVPIRELLKESPPAPLAKPLPLLGQTPPGPVTARFEGIGMSSGNDRMWGLLFLQGTPEDDKRGIRWTLKKGSLQVPGQTTASEVSDTHSTYSFFWHVDTTPKEPKETSTLISPSKPPAATQGDMELQVEGRATLETPFEATIHIPATYEVIQAEDEGEGTLILKKIQRFSDPGNVFNRNVWPPNWNDGGMALVFERNPLLSDADFTPYCFDAEDDLGNRLRMGTLSQGKLYQTDVTRKDNIRYTLFIEDPPSGAKSIKLWLSTQEKSHSVRQQTIQIKNVALTNAK